MTNEKKKITTRDPPMERCSTGRRNGIRLEVLMTDGQG